MRPVVAAFLAALFTGFVLMWLWITFLPPARGPIRTSDAIGRAAGMARPG